MKIPPRIAIPIFLAVICAGLLIAFLWWQLTAATGILRNGPLTAFSAAGTPNIIQTNTENSIDSRDRALLHIRQGDVFSLRGEWRLAQEEYTLAVDADGGLPALRKLARAQLQRREKSGLKSTIRKMKDSGARPESILLLESIALLRAGELVEVRTKMENAEESPHKDYVLALLSIVEGNHENAQQKLESVIGGWEPVLRSYARQIMAAYDEFALFPESSDLHLITLISRALAQVQECELSLPLLLQVTQREDSYRDAWIVQGYCELTTERFAQALSSLEHAYSLDPQKPEIQYFLARAYSALEEHSNAITFFEYALTNGFVPASEIHRLIAAEALEGGNMLLALHQYEAMTKEENPSLEAYEGYVEVSMALGQAEDAYTKAKEAVEALPSEARAHDLLGWAAMETERIEEAHAALTRALELNPFLMSAKERLEDL
jgi:tetratricopeptide (TPR) repeat protein